MSGHARSFLEAVALAPREGQYAASLAKLLTDSGALNEALVYWHRAVAARPEEAPWLNGTGACLQRLGRLEEAVEFFARAQRAVPAHALYGINLKNCRAALQGGGQQALAEPAQQISTQLSNVRLGPPAPAMPMPTTPENSEGEAIYQRGREAQEQGQNMRALALYVVAAEKAPHNARFHYKLATFRHLTLGPTDVNQARLAGAAYREAVRLQPEDPRWRNGYGMYLAEQGETAAAEVHLRQAIVLAPGKQLYGDNLKSLIRGQQTGTAGIDSSGWQTEQLRLALVQDPNHADLNHRWARHLVAQGRAQDSLAYFDHARQLDAENAHITLDLVAVLRRLCRAEQNYRQGVVLADGGRPFLAEPFLRAALEDRPTYSNWQAKLGLCFERMGRYEEGLACFLQALVTAPGYALHSYNAGVMLEKMGRYDEASAYFARSGPVDVSANATSDDTPSRGPQRGAWKPPAPPPSPSTASTPAPRDANSSTSTQHPRLGAPPLRAGAGAGTGPSAAPTPRPSVPPEGAGGLRGPGAQRPPQPSSPAQTRAAPGAPEATHFPALPAPHRPQADTATPPPARGGGTRWGSTR